MSDEIDVSADLSGSRVEAGVAKQELRPDLTALREAMLELPQAQKDLFVLTHVRGKRLAEAARLLGISDAEAVALSTKALIFLRVRMDEYLDLDSPQSIALYRATLEKSGMNQSCVEQLVKAAMQRSENKT